MVDLPVSLKDDERKADDGKDVLQIFRGVNSPEIQPLGKEFTSRLTGFLESGDIKVDISQREGEKKKADSQGMTEADYGFSHPAASRPQRTVWIPRDTLGLSKDEVEGCRAAGVDAECRDAEMNEKGKVDVSGSPPDEVRQE